MSSVPDVTRRRVIAGAAWATPALLLATSSPAAANSALPAPGVACTPSDLAYLPVVTPVIPWAVTTGLLESHTGDAGRTTGWLPTVAQNSTAPNAQYYATQIWNWNETAGFLSMDDTGRQDGPTAITVTMTFDAREGVRYRFAYDILTGHGSHSIENSSRQSLVISASTAKGAKVVDRVAVAHGTGYPGAGKPAAWRTDAQFAADGYALLAPWDGKASRTAEYIADVDGLVTLTYAFTILRHDGSSTSDDIWVSIPKVTPVDCAY